MRTWAAQMWKIASSHALDLLFTRECLACRETLPHEHEDPPLCDACLAQIPAVNWPVCRRCAAEVPPYPGNVPRCFRCETHKLRFDATYSLGHYDGLLRELILRMKTDRNEQVAQIFTNLICKRYGDELRSLAVDAVVPVPMTLVNRLKQKTNPQGAMAAGISRELNIPLFRRLLQRSRHLAPQRGLSAVGRFRNVRGGYRLRKGYIIDAPHILLVDDVMTTGATCSEVARILKHNGVARVTVVVVARTPNN